MTAVAELRRTLAERFPASQPLAYRTAAGLATGIDALDALLPNGGLPRGRLTGWQPGGGATAILRAAARETIRQGERAAWVDAAGLVQGDFWPAGPLLLRPGTETSALDCAEELARCGGFGLVVLGPVRTLGRTAIRLGRAVREGGGVLVVLDPDTSQAQLRVASRFRLNDDVSSAVDPFGEAARVEFVRVEIEARSLGWSGRTEVRLPVLEHAQRMAPDPMLVDRRGGRVRPGWRRGRASLPG